MQRSVRWIKFLRAQGSVEIRMISSTMWNKLLHWELLTTKAQFQAK